MKECAYEEDCYSDLPPCGDRLHRRRMFSALNGRTYRFREYGDEELQVSAFMKCSGCGHFPRQDKGLDEKIEMILEIHPDAVHLGICCCSDGESKTLCKEVEMITAIFKKAGIPVVRGTHSVF